MLYVICMGRWSELSACKVFHCVLFAMVELAVVMSGEVDDYWSVGVGFACLCLV